MPQKPKLKPSWIAYKRDLATRETKELLKLIKALYDDSKMNQEFIKTWLSDSPDDVLQPYKAAIDEAMFPDFRKKQELDLVGAKKTINRYKKASRGKDLYGLLELQIRFVERGTDTVVEYGGLWEQFYVSLEDTFEGVVKTLGQQYESGDSRVVETFLPRLEALVERSHDTGWGYGESLFYTLKSSEVPNKFNRNRGASDYDEYDFVV